MTTTTVDIVAIIAVSTEGEVTGANPYILLPVRLLLLDRKWTTSLFFYEKPIVVANRSHIGQKMRILSISQHQQQNNRLYALTD